MTQAGWRLGAPDGFDDLDWFEVESRNVLMGGHLVHGERRFPCIVYGAYRLTQDAQAESANGGNFCEANVIAIENLTRETAEATVSRLGADGAFDWLLGVPGAGVQLAVAEEKSQADWRLVALDDLDWSDVEDGGLLTSGSLVHGERRFPCVVYDAFRLTDDVDDETANGGIFYEPNVIAIQNLTRETAEATVSRVAAAGFLDWMLGVPSDG
jgi:hypothetical protein